MQDPTVTVVIPTFNRLALLREAVESVKAQTFHDWQLLVVDDGSTDHTAEYVQAEQDQRIDLIRSVHRGNVGAVRNLGVSHARGRFVAFLDSDDLWKPTKLERQMTALRSYGAQWSYTGYEIVDESGRSLKQFVAAQPKDATILNQLLTTEASAAVGSVLVAKDLIDRCGGFSIEPALQCREDHDLVLRLASAAHPSVVSEVLVAVREHRGRTTHSVSDPFLRTATVYERFMERGGDKKSMRIARHMMARHVISSARLDLSHGQVEDAVMKLRNTIRPGWCSARWWWTWTLVARARF